MRKYYLKDLKKCSAKIARNSYLGLFTMVIGQITEQFLYLNAILCLLTKIFDSFLPIPNKTDKFYTNRFFEPFENGMLDMMQLFLAR